MKFNFRESALLKFAGTIFDVLLVHLGYYLAFMFRYDFNPSDRNLDAYINIIPYISMIAFALFTLYGTSLIFKRDFDDNFFSFTISLVFINIATVALAFMFRSFAFPRGIIFIAFFIQFILFFIWKYLISKIKFALSKERSVIIFADNKESMIISEKILNNQNAPYKINAVFSSLNDDAYSKINDADEIFIDSKIDEKQKNQIINYCYSLGKTVFIMPTLYDIYVINSKLEKLDDIPIFKIQSNSHSIEQRIVKRFIDITFSTIILIITIPVFIITAIAIKLYDRGPVIFSQDRVTINNKIFKLYKFRTMIVDAEKNTGPVLAKDKDDRITPLGKFLRATRIDELPQFVNVLKGDMSIVGPRPEREFFIKEYVEKMPEFKYRTTVKAGITGLAQVMGNYETTPEEKIKYDLLYIKKAGILTDLRLMLLTVKVMFKKFSITKPSIGFKKHSI